MNLIQLLVDVEEINSNRKRRCSDNEIIPKLVENEPYKTRWEHVNPNTLRSWLSIARKLERRWLTTMRQFQREAEPVMRAYEALVHPEKQGNET